jgi:cardiolipin synthase
LSPEAQALSRLAENTVNIPALSGNRLELLDAAEPILQAIVSDIDRAEKFCPLEFYIWTEGGLADEVGAALLRATCRGVTCRVLLDAIGSAKFKNSQLLERLKGGGIEVALFINCCCRLFTRPGEKSQSPRPISCPTRRSTRPC